MWCSRDFTQRPDLYIGYVIKQRGCPELRTYDDVSNTEWCRGAPYQNQTWSLEVGVIGSWGTREPNLVRNLPKKGYRSCITTRELVKNPKVRGPGPFNFLFVDTGWYREMSTIIGRGSLRFLEHSYLCIMYTYTHIYIYLYTYIYR